MTKLNRAIPAAGCLSLLLATTACQTTQVHEREVAVDPAKMEAYLSDKPEAARHMYGSVLKQGDRNLVLNHMRAGLAAMDLGADKAAAESFDIALDRIEMIYADNPEAEKARSNFVKENVKDFKGEPYERAMAFYYRGLLYLKEGDYENARASFRGGMLQDTMAADETYTQDFAVLAFLDGWASHCNGDTSMAEDSFAEANSLRKSLSMPASGHNMLMIAEIGKGPLKMSFGEHNEKLRFQKSATFDEVAVNVTRAGKSQSMPLAEDVYWQATTRGGRAVDHVLAGKANFKDGANTAGDILLSAGYATSALSMVSDNLGGGIAGGLIGLAGIGAKMAAANTTPDADTRYWDSLPHQVFVTTGVYDSQSSNVTFAFLDGDKEEIESLRRETNVTTAGKCSIAWGRAHHAAGFPGRAPNSGFAG